MFSKEAQDTGKSGVGGRQRGRQEGKGHPEKRTERRVNVEERERTRYSW